MADHCLPPVRVRVRRRVSSLAMRLQLRDHRHHGEDHLAHSVRHHRQVAEQRLDPAIDQSEQEAGVAGELGADRVGDSQLRLCLMHPAQSAVDKPDHWQRIRLQRLMTE
jgi:hypothetical protein